MSASASRSQVSKFVKRRLMLLILKLAIFIGSSSSECIDFDGRETCCRPLGRDPVKLVIASTSESCLSVVTLSKART
jgi:hypothetical protein